MKRNLVLSWEKTCQIQVEIDVPDNWDKMCLLEQLQIIRKMGLDPEHDYFPDEPYLTNVEDE